MMGYRQLFAAAILSIAIVPLLASSPASAVYYGNLGYDGSTGVDTLEEALRLANQKVVAAEEHVSAGSGTPYFAADGVVGAMAISAGIFGGISATFFVRSRRGKYAAPGLG